MKKNLSLLAVVVVLTGCGKQTANSPIPADEQLEQRIEQTLG